MIFFALLLNNNLYNHILLKYQKQLIIFCKDKILDKGMKSLVRIILHVAICKPRWLVYYCLSTDNINNSECFLYISSTDKEITNSCS
jgi:hypothetical protein